MAAQDALVVALAGRYASGGRTERGRMLDEFTAVSVGVRPGRESSLAD